MQIEFSGKIWFWKGPAPWYFVTVPVPQCHELKAISGAVTYGWGMIPATVRIGQQGVVDRFVAQGWPVHCAHQSEYTQSGKARGR